MLLKMYVQRTTVVEELLKLATFLYNIIQKVDITLPPERLSTDELHETLPSQVDFENMRSYLWKSHRHSITDRSVYMAPDHLYIHCCPIN